jgi:hypothetical protein
MFFKYPLHISITFFRIRISPYSPGNGAQFPN